MIKIKSLSVKNFMSIGNATQAVDFDRKDLTLVLGENLDLGGDDNGARNGTGKTTIINALSYALYGNALTNIKKDNLINKTNTKNMLVTIDFEYNGNNYRIERGRKPNILKYFVNSVEQNNEEEKNQDDNSQGDSRETQNEIERLINMSHDMFKHVVALNTYTEPFLSMRANDQRTIIEQLLGITLLSEKAESLKEQIRINKETISAEEIKIKTINDANNKVKEQINSLMKRQKLWLTKKQDDINTLQQAYDELATLDIESELENHKKLNIFNKNSEKLKNLKSNLVKTNSDLTKEFKQKSKVEQEISSLENHTCHSCGQPFHDQNHSLVLDTKQKLLVEINAQIINYESQINSIQKEIDDLGDLGSCPKVFYTNESDAFEHRSSMASILGQISSKQGEEDPYGEQIKEMQEQAITKIDYEFINQLTKIKDHQEFLLKLLTNKDSFIRKRIIDQNLNYLNARLGYYLDKIGLPHVVKFNNDLTVSIEELGRELDFDNLSRGERNRLILSLSWAFRDVWESLYQQINLLFIDELVDSGMDSSGVENALAILKKMSRDTDKSIWLVSHKDELIGRVNNVLRVVKENGFTNYNTDIDIH